MDALAEELPPGTIRLSSKLARVDDHGALKVLHLADGSVLKTKVIAVMRKSERKID